MSANTIFEDLKSAMPSEYEKETPGFLTYDLLKSAAIELDKMYEAVKVVESKLNVTNLIGDELSNECYYRRGIARKLATYAKVVLRITGNGQIYSGHTFSTPNGVRFSSLTDIYISGTGTINAQCDTVGTIGVVGAGSITEIPTTIPGITAVNNEAASYDGFEEETDESLLERYLDDVRSPATSNNIYHFEKWAKEISGVGKARVLPCWNGNNSVKVIVINADMLPASSNIVQAVQEYIDPMGTNWGKGYGQAAIGSYCTVESATAKELNISAIITKSINYTTAQITSSIQAALRIYFKDIAFDEKTTYISYAKITSLIMSVPGVIDAADLYVNGLMVNVTLSNSEVPVLGAVTISFS